ncbi:metal ABC transporter permease [Georgenia sp. H159]|uniref:metal ABC transporter permease n=1 Tax=Georgenia sp. H159 TaxID=3076115 RepID=UPI002D7842F6|nr:metal ABC transporter permease [Georgenia sp. H159]
MNVDLVIIVTALLVVVPCALLGSILVLRQTVMVGDAISHAALPGIVLAFFLTGSLGPLAAVAGAAVFGLLTVVLVDALQRGGRVRGDAATGIVFTGLFALGVLLIARYGGNVHLDLEHVLFGEIAFSPLTVLTVGGVDLGPRSWWTTGVVAVVVVAAVVLLYKELKLTTFDPALAAVVGLSPVVVHQVLMALVSVTVVGAFDSVGAILVVAFLAGPAATAYLLTERLTAMLTAALAVGALAAAGGYGLAVVWDVSIAGMMASAVGVLFVIALLLAPRHGLVAAAVARERRSRQLRRELVAHARRSLGGQPTTAELAARLHWPPAEVERVTARLD